MATGYICGLLKRGMIFLTKIMLYPLLLFPPKALGVRILSFCDRTNRCLHDNRCPEQQGMLGMLLNITLKAAP